MKEIIFSKSALKFLKKQNENTQIRLIKAIKEIPNGDIRNYKFSLLID